MPRLAIAAAVAAATTLFASAAFACACCTAPGFRHVEVEKLDAARLAEIADIRFAKSAHLRMREEDGGGLVAEPQERYELRVAQQKQGLVFSLRDEKNRSGTLTLALPKTVSIFEVDPRDGKDEGHGPILYKEWKLTANAAGDGIFRKAAGGARKMTLVLHGRGLACTQADDFTHWTLLVYGPAEHFTLYGALDRAKP
jgi:hypothetical protein